MHDHSPHQNTGHVVATMENESAILQSAIAGDRLAVGRLLMHYDSRLRRKVSTWIPRHLQRHLTVDDVLQETYAEAYRHIGGFDPKTGDSFYAWLARIAQSRFLNARRWLLAGKRAADKRVSIAANKDASIAQLVQLLSADETTASGKAARKENARLLHVALAGLKEDYRNALRLRYIDGRSVREIAKEMGRTERAVHMLCHRGLRALREHMGSASKFLSTGR